MKENKYYTPSIEEFHVGFEYERFIPRSNATEEECWDKLSMSVNYLSLDELDDEIIEKEIRVKYLDKEDIEDLGFDLDIIRVVIPDKYEPYLNLNNGVGIIFNKTNSSVRITIPCDKIYRKIVFDGKIKNKSELKEILEKII
jgi:hypothetical protein